MSTNSHTYFSNHSQPRLPSTFNAHHTPHDTSGTYASSVTNTSSPSAHHAHPPASGNHPHPANANSVNNSTGGLTAPAGTRPRSSTSTSVKSKHFLLSVSGQERESGSAANGEKGVNGSSELAKTVHPLRSTWVFWFRQQFHPATKTTNYEEGIKKITAFSSVESFWSLWTHLHPPSAVQPTTDYLLFHSQVRSPIWEDPWNIAGGKWIIRLKKGVSDRLWEDLVLGVISDQFEEADEVCGVVLSVRAQEDILSVWNKNEKDSAARGRISDTIRRILNLQSTTVMEYKSNTDSLTDKSSFRTTPVERPS